MGVHETNLNGVALDTKSHLLQRTKYTHECCITLKSWDFEQADLRIDDVAFHFLPQRTEHREEDQLTIQTEVLHLEYDILVPYAVNADAPTGISAIADTVVTMGT